MCVSGLHLIGLKKSAVKNIKGLPWRSSDLRLRAPKARGPDLIPAQGTRSHMPQLRVYMPQLKIDPECCN